MEAVLAVALVLGVEGGVLFVGGFRVGLERRPLATGVLGVDGGLDGGEHLGDQGEAVGDGVGVVLARSGR